MSAVIVQCPLSEVRNQYEKSSESSHTSTYRNTLREVWVSRHTAINMVTRSLTLSILIIKIIQCTKVGRFGWEITPNGEQLATLPSDFQGEVITLS